LVGGTGFYLRALLDGLFPGPQRDPRVRRRLYAREQKRRGSLHRILSRLDPASATRVHANDTNKLVRALEVCLLTRQPLSALHAQGREPLCGFRVLKLGLDPPREELFAGLDERTRRMFDSGLLEEVRRVLALGFLPEAKALSSLGYRQALAAIRGDITVEEAITLTQRDTRRYAKRQWTWFRREPDIRWLSGFGGDPAIQSAAIQSVHSHRETASQIPTAIDETFS
jgi:tRNA dimethylallyltransferase